MNIWKKLHPNKYRITSVLKVETDIISSISVSPIWRAVILVIRSVDTFKSDVIVFIGDVMCLTSDWPINLHMPVTNWPNIFVDQSQFSDPDFISGTHQRENVQFANKSGLLYLLMQDLLYLCHMIIVQKCVTLSRKGLWCYRMQMVNEVWGIGNIV